MKLFAPVNYTFSLQARGLVSGMFFQPCLMFVGKASCLT